MEDIDYEKDLAEEKIRSRECHAQFAKLYPNRRYDITFVAGLGKVWKVWDQNKNQKICNKDEPGAKRYYRYKIIMDGIVRRFDLPACEWVRLEKHFPLEGKTFAFRYDKKPNPFDERNYEVTKLKLEEGCDVQIALERELEYEQ